MEKSNWNEPLVWTFNLECIHKLVAIFLEENQNTKVRLRVCGKDPKEEIQIWLRAENEFFSLDFTAPLVVL